MPGTRVDWHSARVAKGRRATQAIRACIAPRKRRRAICRLFNSHTARHLLTVVWMNNAATPRRTTSARRLNIAKGHQALRTAYADNQLDPRSIFTSEGLSNAVASTFRWRARFRFGNFGAGLMVSR